MLKRMLRRLAGVRPPSKRAALGDDDADDEGEIVGIDKPPEPKEFSVTLPAGYPARRIDVRLSVPALPADSPYRFSDHVTDELGRPTRTILATTTGGFGISRDLGETWKHIPVRAHKTHRFIHVRSIGNSEYLAQAQLERDPTKTVPLDLLVIDEAGNVRAKHRAHGTRWHGCRAIDQSNGTIMYAEYPSGDNPRPSRVFRSRDRGRSWDVAFERNSEQIRHFHFLQANPRVAGEWWLTSGDNPEECRIWLSKNDGEGWVDYTDIPETIDIDGITYPRSIFRLTDLAWDGDEIIWGTDDTLPLVTGDSPGARVFRSAIKRPFAPRPVGHCRWHIRSIVDVGEFYFVLTQGSNRGRASPEERKPNVLLMPKKSPPGAPGLLHLFDVDIHSPKPRAGRGFTYSKASRAAIGGTFFTYRAPFHVWPAGHQILRWDVTFS